MSSALQQIPPVMDVQEFIAWNAPAGARWQLVEGVPVAMAPTSRTHGVIQGELGRLIGNHLLARDLPCQVITAPGIVPRVRAHNNFRIPDLAVTCTPYQEEEYDVADPVLVIEILSPSNQQETWLNVWAYASMPSVREIVVVNSTSIAVEILRRDANGDWPPKADRITEGEVTFVSIDFTTPIETIYRGTRLLRGAGTTA
jgi:Uma2 family endonuclease